MILSILFASFSKITILMRHIVLNSDLEGLPLTIETKKERERLLKRSLPRKAIVLVIKPQN